MTKVFISQPMQGKTDEEIKRVRDTDIEFIKTVYPDAEIIDSLSGVYMLGQSIQLLARADVLFLSAGWDKARGCRIEHSVAVAYGIKCYYAG